MHFSRGPLCLVGEGGEAGLDANVPVLFQGHLSFLGLLGKDIFATGQEGEH